MNKDSNLYQALTYTTFERSYIIHTFLRRINIEN